MNVVVPLSAPRMPGIQGDMGGGHLEKRATRRKWRFASLSLGVLLPTALVSAYLYGVADDQYVTEFRFNIQHASPMRMDGMSSGGGMAAAAVGGPGGSSPLAVITDSQIVVQYLKSAQVIEDITAAGIDLNQIYSNSDRDILAHLPPSSLAEQRLRYWRRVVDPFYDMTSGIVSVEVRAFNPADAKRVANMALNLSEKLVNDISNKSRNDTLSYITKEVVSSKTKLEDAQTTIADYRNKHAVLFPEMQATADTTLGGKIQETLIEAQTAYAAQLAQGVSKDTVQMNILANRILAMRRSVQTVQDRLTQTGTTAKSEESLASVMSQYGVLHLSEEIAAKVYERALIAQQDARNAASQQGIYLAAFVRPALPQASMYPIRWRMLLETALLSFVGWCLLQLLYHGIRDHID